MNEGYNKINKCINWNFEKMFGLHRCCQKRERIHHRLGRHIHKICMWNMHLLLSCLTKSCLCKPMDYSLLDPSVLCYLLVHVYSHAQRLTLYNPMYCNPPDPSVHGIFHARILEWVAISSSRGSSWPSQGSNTHLLHFLLCRWILYPWAFRENCLPEFAQIHVHWVIDAI